MCISGRANRLKMPKAAVANGIPYHSNQKETAGKVIKDTSGLQGKSS